MTGKYRSYAGTPRVYLTYGIHEDGQWKRMWYVNMSLTSGGTGEHFWTWREAIDYALALPLRHPYVRWRRDDPLGRSGRVGG